MRYINLTDDINDDDYPDHDAEYAEKVVKILKAECQPFLETREILYRGMYEAIPDPFSNLIYKMTTKPDRDVLDSSSELTALMNKLYAETGSSITRTNCIFTHPSSAFAGSYGDVYAVFPIGNFEALWNNQINDAHISIDRNRDYGKFHDPILSDEQKNEMFQKALKNANIMATHKDTDYFEFRPKTSEEIQRVADKLYHNLLGDYQVNNDAPLDIKKIYKHFTGTFNTELGAEPLDEVEVMLKSPTYYAVDATLFDNYVDEML